MMASYEVYIEATVYTDFVVEAKNKAEAIEKAKEELSTDVAGFSVLHTEVHKIKQEDK